MTDTAARRTALDWLRIAAFALLILYHVGMFYVSWGWHVKSSHAGAGIEPLMLAVNPWRLLLLFMISGVATRYMADKMSAGAFVGARIWRLLPPLALAIFVIVPPQTYLEIVEKLGYAGSWQEFFELYVSGYDGWRPGGQRLIVPTYNHMWFVAYLLAYTLVLAVLLPVLRRLPKFPTGGWAPIAFFAAPWFVLLAARGFLEPAFGETHAFIDDFYAHAIYFPAFLFGYVIAKRDDFFEACARHRGVALMLAVGAFAGLMMMRALIAPNEADLWLGAARVALRETQALAAIVALIGFAHLHWTADTPLRRYLTDAIFPFYLVHQTVIVVAGHALDAQGWPVWLEAAALVAITVAACFATYEIARRIPLLRPFFGLRLRRRTEPQEGKRIEPEARRGHIEAEA